MWWRMGEWENDPVLDLYAASSGGKRGTPNHWGDHQIIWILGKRPVFLKASLIMKW